MEIKLLFFGELAEILSKKSIIINLDKTQSIESINEELVIGNPKLQHINYKIARNKRIGPTNQLVEDGDILAFLPPYSGG